jgi:hypothetical protein
MRAARPVHIIFLDMTTLIIKTAEKYGVWRSSLCDFLRYVHNKNTYLINCFLEHL